jgi:hypothetical protein
MPAIVFRGDRDNTVHPRNADHLLAHYWDANEAPRATKSRGQVPGGVTESRRTLERLLSKS